MITHDTRDADLRTPIAGFWVRLLGQLIDGLLWGALATLIGVSLVALAPNIFGLSGSIIEQRECQGLSALPPHIPLPADLSPTGAYLCSKSIFGFRYRTEIVVVEERREGGVTMRKLATFPVNQDLELAGTIDVDPFLWAGFLIYLLAGQAYFGVTAGKLLLGLRVLGPEGGPPGFRRALVRNGVLWAPTIAGGAILLILFATGQFYRLAAGLALALVAVAGFLTLALGAEIWWTATHQRPSIHDRIAGTRVVRPE